MTSDPLGLLRALSLWNPHAGLMAAGAKRCESRGRTFGVRGAIAIASTIAVPSPHRDALGDQMQREPFARWCRAEGWTSLDAMPRGCIVALVWITGETRVVGDLMRRTIAETYGPDELAFGWYQDGRVAIHTDPARLIRLPVPWSRRAVKASGASTFRRRRGSLRK